VNAEHPRPLDLEHLRDRPRSLQVLEASYRHSGQTVEADRVRAMLYAMGERPSREDAA